MGGPSSSIWGDMGGAGDVGGGSGSGSGSGMDRRVRRYKSGDVRSDGGGDFSGGSSGGGGASGISAFPSVGVVGGPAWKNKITGTSHKAAVM